jgi:hypothetical protein
MLVCYSCGLTMAQDYLTGKIITPQSAEHQIYYDRTEYMVGNAIYQTVYKVLDLNKTRIYTVTILHDQLKGALYVSTREIDAPYASFAVKYDKHASGLIFSSKGNCDTVYKVTDSYEYLISFADTDRDYAVLHRLKVGAGTYLQLDPISKAALKRHCTLVKSLGIVQANRPAEPQKDPLLVRISALRDSLYTKSAFYYGAIAELRSGMEADVKLCFHENKIYDNDDKYAGEKKRGKPDGKGLQLINGNIYDGVFNKGNFVSGKVVLRHVDSEYYGQFDNTVMNGAGWLKYKTGDFSLGVFAAGKLETGISLSHASNGDVFYGSYQNGQRTGYAEMRNRQGNCYYGEFQQGRLIRGFAKEVDQFGYSTFSRIENGVKKTIDPKEAGDFFDSNLTAKK